VVSWVGSIQAFLVVFVGVIAGPLFDRGYLRALVFTGCFLTVFGMMMTSMARSYYQVFLAQGICVGVGEGLTYVPSLAVISTHFTTKRPIAIGIASVGSSIGKLFL
jgi:MFS family permease